jgi:poly-gamma-glutamate synthesis protein (capsule biosynthesis protein)
MIDIIIGGDVCPCGINFPYFQSGDVNKIFNDLYVEFEEADISIINLECPLIKKKTPILKNGPILGVDDCTINGFKAAKIDILNLANNHILDHGSSGLENTLNVCRNANIKVIGAGRNIHEARKIEIIKINNIRIGILGIAEHEFSIATNYSHGANSCDLIETFRNINDNIEHFDYLIVLYHGGNEYYPYPSPRLRNTCQFLIEIGANIVVVQHTHCPGTCEEYRGGHIVYGQGNLIFDLPNRQKSFYEGFLVKVSVNSNFDSNMDVIPYFQSGTRIGAKKMEGKSKEEFLQNLKERSAAIMDEFYFQTLWTDFCKKKRKEYMKRILGHNYLFKKLIRANLFTKYFCNRQSIALLQNTISCEAHREVLETLFRHKMI